MEYAFIAVSSMILVGFGVSFGEMQDFNGTYYEVSKGVNNTSVSEGSPTYDQIRINIHNFVLAEQQRRNTTAMMEQNHLDMKNAIKQELQKNPLPTESQVELLLKTKFELSKITTYNDIEKRSWYDKEIQLQKADIFKSLEDYLVNGRNGTPDFTTCQAWHTCKNVFNDVVKKQ